MKNFAKDFKSMLLSPKLHILVTIPFLVWIFLMRGFILCSYSLITDAMVYYDHFQYFTENISRGVFPFWDPSYNSGLPTEFFLRRIGEFNPFFVIMLIAYKSGLPFLVCFPLFASIYYFMGAFGFYLISRQIFKDERAALVAYLLLYFSSLSTLLFCSFIVLIFTPMVWLFYFLLVFYETREKYTVLGATFCLMILASTYIPFYFLTIFLIFLGVFIALYARVFKSFCLSFRQFAGQHKMFVAFCGLILSLSCIPTLQFYVESQTGEMVLPTRHYNAPAQIPLSVPIQRSDFGGIIPHLVIEELYIGAKQMQLSRIYVPFFFNFLLLTAFVVKLNKKLTLLFLWGYLVLVISLYDAVIYKFLYNHVFFFKYFRNFQFFFWLAVLPIFILICAEQFRLFLNVATNTKMKRISALVFIILIHILAVVFLYLNQPREAQTYYAVAAVSFLFFLGHWMGWLKPNSVLTWGVLLLVLVIDPFEVYHYMNINSKPLSSPYRYGLDQSYRKINLLDEKEALATINRPPVLRDAKAASSMDEQTLKYIYFGSKWYSFLVEHLDVHTLAYYTDRKLVVYDRVEYMADQDLDINKVTEVFRSNKNLAIVSSKESELMNSRAEKINPQAEIVTQHSPSVKVLDYNVNFIKLKTNYHIPKFLVYNDNDHRDWRLFINGQKKDIVRANIAFKGVWLPAGENIVYFRFGNSWKFLGKLFFVFVFSGVFIYLCALWMSALKGRYFQNLWASEK